MRRREYGSSSAYASEFTQTFPGSITGRIGTIEDLLWLERGAGKSNAVRYLVQIISKPHQIIVLEIWHTLPIFLPMQYVVELVTKPGRGLVKEMQPLQGRGVG